MPNPTPERVAVCLTRTKNEVSELLVQREEHRQGASAGLPETQLLPNEHPAEAAWRLLKDAFDRDSCRTFHKLAQVATEDGSYHVFQSGLDEELPEPLSPLIWLEQGLATAKLDTAWHSTLTKLR